MESKGEQVPELKPCPFCGSPAEERNTWIWCTSNSCRMRKAGLKREEWNTRADIAPDTRVPGDGQMSAEGWLAYVGYADSRIHSAPAIAELLTAYADYRNAATTPPCECIELHARLKSGSKWCVCQCHAGENDVPTGDLISREAAMELAYSWDNEMKVNPSRWIGNAIGKLPAAQPPALAAVAVRAAAIAILEHINGFIKPGERRYSDADAIAAIITRALSGETESNK